MGRVNLDPVHRRSRFIEWIVIIAVIRFVAPDHRRSGREFFKACSTKQIPKMHFERLFIVGSGAHARHRIASSCHDSSCSVLASVQRCNKVRRRHDEERVRRRHRTVVAVPASVSVCTWASFAHASAQTRSAQRRDLQHASMLASLASVRRCDPIFGCRFKPSQDFESFSRITRTLADFRRA